MPLITATTYIDEATAYKMEVQGTTANIEYESGVTAPALIEAKLNRSIDMWEVKVTVFESSPIHSGTSLEEYLNELDDVAKAADAFRNALNMNHRPQEH